MPKTTLVAINGSAGAFVDIPSSIPARRVEIREDEAGTAQGLAYHKPDDNFVATYTVGVPAGPDSPQIALGNPVAAGHGTSPILGYPAQTGLLNTPASVYCKIRSKTVTATSVRVVEFD